MPSDYNIPDSFDGFCSLWPGTDPGRRMRGILLPPAIVKNVFDVHNFSIILNLFDRALRLKHA